MEQLLHPCMYNEKLGLPLVGVMIFDTADTADIVQLGKLELVVVHEMMHVFGYGVTWHPRYGPDGTLVSNFSYTGAKGVAEFQKLTGKPETFIPVQGAAVNGGVYFNVSTGDGQGSLDSHINIDMFGNALMTFGLDYESKEHEPLTAMSLGMLRDIGYTVNTTVADEYALPKSIEGFSYSLRGHLS
eukprot:maker-scaffold_43-snap-gene-0.0-mRNA-1 protein AED:0.13 eAED:0.51 QI:691/0/0.33/1/0.5/0.33/3/0/185